MFADDPMSIGTYVRIFGHWKLGRGKAPFFFFFNKAIFELHISNNFLKINNLLFKMIF